MINSFNLPIFCVQIHIEHMLNKEDWLIGKNYGEIFLSAIILIFYLLLRNFFSNFKCSCCNFYFFFYDISYQIVFLWVKQW